MVDKFRIFVLSFLLFLAVGCVAIESPPATPPAALSPLPVEPRPVVVAVPTPTPTPVNVWYLQAARLPAGPASPDGRSIDSAWRKVSQVDFSRMEPWDELRIGSGVYAGMLRPSVDYVQIKPLATARDPIVFDGGRSARLPECGQATWQSPDLGDDYAFWIEGVTGVVVDGGPQRLIEIRNYRYGGIRLEPSSRAVSLKSLKIFENGSAIAELSGWRPARPGIVVGGADHRFIDLIVRDNGEDAIQSHYSPQNNLRNLLVSGSWVHNSRLHSRQSGLPYNHCTHTDGLQIYSGGLVLDVTVVDSVIGPNVTNGVILGDKGTGAQVNYVTIRNSSFVGITDNAYLDNSPGALQFGWRVENNRIMGGRYR